MSKEDLLKFFAPEAKKNIAEVLDQDKLNEISTKVLETFQEDFTSMQEWFSQAEESIKLAALEKEPKNTPFPNAANVKYPLITDACMKFAAEIYPEIIKDGQVVKATVLGADPDGSKKKKAERISEYMSYQLLFRTTEWEKQLDTLLNTLPNIGFMVKKTYYDPIEERVCTELCDYRDIIINSDAKSLKDAVAITHILHFRLNDLVMQSRHGLFLEKSVCELYELHKNNNNTKHIDCLEQHRDLDLDDDGFTEPYIVTVEKETGKMLRILPRYDKKGIKVNQDGQVKYITKKNYFTDYHFLPNPKGKFQSVGFGTLMLHLNLSINTILNQLIDAGTLNNMQGGYIDSRLKFNSGLSRHNPGEWIRVKASAGQLLKDGFLPLEYKAPSNVLSQLLGMLIQAGKELSSSTQAMQGSAMPDNAKTGAVNALIDRGLKVFNAITRRVYRSLKDEYQQIFDLDATYMNEVEYIMVVGDVHAIYKGDFDIESIDVMPVADPNMSSDTQRLAQLQVLQAMKQDPNINIQEIDTRMLQFAKVSEPEKIFLPPSNKPSPEEMELQLKVIDQQKKSKQKDVELHQKQEELQMAQSKLDAEVAVLKSTAMRNIAQAESFPIQHQFKDLEFALKALQTKFDAVMQLHQNQHDQAMQQAQQDHEQNMQQNQIEADQDAAAQQQQGSSDGVDGSPND